MPGKIVDMTGKVVGRHTGLVNYTIGQRKGLTITSPIPLYVLRKDVLTNTLVVGEINELGLNELVAQNVNWVSGEAKEEPFRAEVKIRYTAKETAGKVNPLDKGNRVQIVFETPQRDITSGQAAVFYENEVMIGGGIIQ